MSENRDYQSRDEMDAISAESLLAKLRSGLANKSEPSGSQENVRNAGKISDEAMEIAKKEVIHAKPDEFGVDNLEDRLRAILNVPKDDEDDVSDVLSGNAQVDEDETVSEDNPENAALNEEPTVGDVPESNIDEVLSAIDNVTEEPISDDTLIYSDELAETAIFGDLPKITEEENKRVEDDGFLTQVAKLVEEGKTKNSDEEYDEFAFITDDDKTSANEGGAVALENDVPITEDGGREYSGLNGVEISSTEMSLLSLFGGVDELEEAYGKEKAKEIIKERSEAPLPTVPRKKKFYELFSPDFEYVSCEQNEIIKTTYSKAFKSATVRFLCCLFFSLILLVFENAQLLSLKLPDFLNSDFYPVVVAMINLQLLLLCAYTVYGKLAEGFADLFKLKPSPMSVPSLLLAMSVIYTFAIAFVSNRPGAQLYNFPTSTAFVFTALCEVLTLKREAMSFDIVSSGRKIFTVRTLSKEEKEDDAVLFQEYVPDDSEMFAVTRTRFVENFFERIGKRVYNRNIPVLMIIAFAGVLLSAGFGIYLSKDIYSVITMAYLALVLGLPGTVIFAGCFPFYRISKNAYENESAIIGNSSIEEYSEGSVVFFDDKDIFPSTGVKINSVKVYGENRIDEVIYMAASIFSKIGGPLADVFSLATIEIGHSDSVELIETSENGLRCKIDDKSIYLGNNDYLVSNDFETPYGEGDEALENNNGIRLMFIADENEVLAKFYVQYTVDSEYEIVFNQLYKAGMCVGIRTWDPNISEEFIMRKLRLKRDYPVKVVHGRPGKEFTRRLERTSSGIVSAGTVKSLLKVLSSCDKIKYISKIHGIFQVVSAVVAILAVYGVTILGKLEMGSLFAALYSLFWLVPIMLVAMFAD